FHCPAALFAVGRGERAHGRSDAFEPVLVLSLTLVQLLEDLDLLLGHVAPLELDETARAHFFVVSPPLAVTLRLPEALMCGKIIGVERQHRPQGFFSLGAQTPALAPFR